MIPRTELPKLLPTDRFYITLESHNGYLLKGFTGKGMVQLHSHWIDIHLVKFIYHQDRETHIYLHLKSRLKK